MKQKLVIAAFAMLAIAVAANLQYAFSGYGIKESVSLRHAIMAQTGTTTDPSPDGETTIQCDRSSEGSGQCFELKRILKLERMASFFKYFYVYKCEWNGATLDHCSKFDLIFSSLTDTFTGIGGALIDDLPF